MLCKCIIQLTANAKIKPFVKCLPTGQKSFIVVYSKYLGTTFSHKPCFETIYHLEFIT